MSKAGADALRNWFTEADQGVKDLDTAATAAFKHMQTEAGKVLTSFKTSLEGTFDIAEIDARATQLERYHNAYKLLMDKAGGDLRVLGTISVEAVATIAAASKQGMNSLADVDKKVTENGQLEFEAHKRMAEVSAKEDHERCEQAKKDAADLAKAAKSAQAAWETRTEQEYEGFQKRREAAAKAAKELATIAAESAKIDEHHIELLRDEDMWRIKVQGAMAKEDAEELKQVHLHELNNRLLHDMKLKSEELQKVWRHSHPVLAQVRNDLQGLNIDITKFSDRQMVAIDSFHQFESATISAGVAAAIYGENVGQAMLKALKATLTSIAEQAAVQSIFSLATYFIDMATYQYAAAAHALTAAELFGSIAVASGVAGAVIPGGGGGVGGGGGSASIGGNQSRYGVGDGSSGGGVRGPAQPGGGHGPTIIVNQYGPVVGTWAQAGKAIANVLNQLTQTGQVKLVATNALTSGPKIT